MSLYIKKKGLVNKSRVFWFNYSLFSKYVLFNKSKTMLMFYPAGSDATTYEIPDTVTELYDYAFSSASNFFNVKNASVTFKRGAESAADIFAQPAAPNFI